MANYFDELILAEIRKNNQAALGELYKTHYPMAAHLVCSNSGTEQEAKDVFQDAIIAFYERAQQADFVLTCKIKTYLYAVCRRLWLKRLAEKRRFDVTIAEGDVFEGLEDEIGEVLESEISFERMQLSLQALGEPCRSIIEDFYIRDFSMDLIREKFGYTSADNAKNQKYKCLQRLKKLFFEDHRKEK
ncbi:MAG TPA: sigma-70 family RNA polymerase sigma factor [Cyclobacteriaceae bacterium]|nr:sigma-70 family RNA polymerase sigma factor [Cyclobacteriaceae bacterium]HMV89010.1 sigma-70 family RNA polymerase sigma factor [Cyclobacteriaceae bacterium]HMW99259.1 sigma-70 family RNA polymerase sigma factor [Cyclobacteriaceae bacterium]HMX48952.1 sigma-70 family RNA polymerase sigma factor [Cyclobacteriaceae bacterium]HMY94611.1 sigma-70 family RNA polymerase sigma factor [Cyclobacteriaceae bacterium]